MPLLSVARLTLTFTPWCGGLTPQHQFCWEQLYCFQIFFSNFDKHTKNILLVTPTLIKGARAMLGDSSQTPGNQRLDQLIELSQPSFHVFNTNQNSCDLLFIAHNCSPRYGISNQAPSLNPPPTSLACFGGHQEEMRHQSIPSFCKKPWCAEEQEHYTGASWTLVSLPCTLKFLVASIGLKFCQY